MSVLDSPNLPAGTEGLAGLKILVFCTAVNSFTQRVLTQLRDYGFTRVSTCVATDERVMCDAAQQLEPDLVICPFLTRIIPDTVFKKVRRREALAHPSAMAHSSTSPSWSTPVLLATPVRPRLIGRSWAIRASSPTRPSPYTPYSRLRTRPSRI
jgi:hypothetical protein